MMTLFVGMVFWSVVAVAAIAAGALGGTVVAEVFGAEIPSHHERPTTGGEETQP